MSIFNKKEKKSKLNNPSVNPENTTLEGDDKQEISEEEAKAILSKFDRESSVREFKGWKKTALRYAFILYTIFALYINISGSFAVQIHRAAFLAPLIFFSFILYPAKKSMPKHNNKVPWYDIVLAVVGALSFLYIVFNFENLVYRGGSYITIDYIIGGIGILLLLEACRRVVGIPILCVVLAFIAYAYFGSYIPGDFGHRGFSIERIISHLFYTTEGVIGTPLGVCSTFIFLFILFGCFLEKTGVGQFFIDLANSIAGKATGGPAKVAVIASALQGMISGSSVANTVGSGSFTIPMMKKMGYKPEFAAAVEAAASTGGQIMPPIMGAAAFLMADMTSIPYSTIVVAAIIPAVLYFSGILLMIHFEAKKLGLKGLSPELVPHFGKLFTQKWFLLLPLITIVGMMMSGYTPSKSALYAIVVAIVVSMFRKDTRLTINKFFDALENGSRNIIGVGVACAAAGIIVGVVTLTGLGLKLAAGLLSLSGGITIVALFFTMIASIVLGMGVPTTANYVIMATITAPVVMELGVPILAAHMFVFYFGILADITPPVALAAYAGSAIAKSNPLKTGVTATRLAITAFIIPYIFALNPAMLLIGAEPFDIILVVITSVLGMLGIASAMEGYWITTIKPLERIIALAGGLTLIIPGIATDIIGLVLLSILFLTQIRRHRHEKEMLA